jgi:TRAP-type mannitol/chloroaromatic compound transport system permease small subunit
MRTLFRISNLLARVLMTLGKIAAWSFVPLMMIIVVDVVMRRYFVIGSIRLQELEWHLHTILFMFCLGYAYLANAHVRIELIRERLPEWARLTIELIGAVALLLPLCWILVTYSIDLVQRSYAIGEASPHAGGLPHRWLIKSVLPLGFALLALSGVVTLLRTVALLFGSPELREEIYQRSQSEERKIEDVAIGERR